MISLTNLIFSRILQSFRLALEGKLGRKIPVTKIRVHRDDLNKQPGY